MIEKKEPIEESRIKGQQAMLEMAKDYEKNPAKIQHAIEAYKEVIVSSPDSKEADEEKKKLEARVKELEGKSKQEA